MFGSTVGHIGRGDISKHDKYMEICTFTYEKWRIYRYQTIKGTVSPVQVCIKMVLLKRTYQEHLMLNFKTIFLSNSLLTLTNPLFLWKSHFLLSYKFLLLSDQSQSFYQPFALFLIGCLGLRQQQEKFQGVKEDGQCCTVYFSKATGKICQCWYDEKVALPAFLVHLELLQMPLEIGK